MKFGTGVDLDDVWVDLENQGHRSKVKVMRSNTVFLHSASGNIHRSIQRSMAIMHWPPMNKFACKLHGYIVYFEE